MNVSSEKIPHYTSPILSICIPTFNRAIGLDKLLRNLVEIKKMHGETVEICVSNNHSTDNTGEVIDSWRELLMLTVATQSENIGLTRNCIAVSSISSGKWIMLIGDDDGINGQNFSKLMAYLGAVDEGDWILAGVADSSGKEALLGPLKAGRHDANSFRKIMLRTGLYRYGFIAMHIFPSTQKEILLGLTSEQSQPWPHLAIFLRHIQDGYVRVFPTPVAQQAGGGAMLFWNIYDMANIKLRKLNIIAEARTTVKKHLWFYDALIVRELYLARDARTLVFWKALEPSDFNHRALLEYLTRYTLVRKPFIFLLIFHFVLLLAAYVTPSYVMKIMLNLIGQRGAMAQYRAKK